MSGPLPFAESHQHNSILVALQSATASNVAMVQHLNELTVLLQREQAINAALRNVNAKLRETSDSLVIEPSSVERDTKDGYIYSTKQAKYDPIYVDDWSNLYKKHVAVLKCLGK